ncbi:hypothetical protein [Rummeliibacillus stabekisii]|uniref:hypothetical protein n=1 Tax=Rummeliibacillus stabekisii TaxID=241244 RepID=UPI003D813C96
MFVPYWSYLTGKTFLLAMGQSQSYFSLSVGVAAMMAYDSYLPKIEKIVGAAFNVAWLNIGISLLAGLVIFPAVFALGFTPTKILSLLVFIVLPAVFQ